MLDCGCDETTYCETAEMLQGHLLACWRGETAACPVDMFESTGAPQRQRLICLRASLDFHDHRGALTPDWVYVDITRAAHQLFVPPPPRRLPVGNYGKSARAVMQLEFLASLAAGRSFIQSAADLEADRRTVYSWMETDAVFRWAVEQLRSRV